MDATDAYNAKAITSFLRDRDQGINVTQCCSGSNCQLHVMCHGGCARFSSIYLQRNVKMSSTKPIIWFTY